MNNNSNQQNNQGLSIALISCSQSQLRYFSQLSKQLKDDDFADITLLDYKKIKFDLSSFLRVFWVKAMTSIELAQIKQQVSLYIRRKQYTSWGLKKKQWYWNIVSLSQSIIGYYLFFRYKKVFQSTNYSHLIVWNGKKFHQAIICIAAKHYQIKCVYMETGPLPGYMQISQNGVDASSNLPKNPDFYLQYCQDAQQSGLSPQHKDDEIKVFVPFQVVEDSNIYCHSPWITHMRHLYEQLVACAEKFPQLSFFVKEHPDCEEMYDDLKCLHYRIKFVSPKESITCLLSQSNFVITVNSTVGLEALMAQKPLITLGDAIYNIGEIVQTVSTTKTLYTAIEDVLQGWQPNPQVLNGFLYYLQNNYAVKGSMESSSAKQRLMMSQKIKQVLPLEVSK